MSQADRLAMARDLLARGASASPSSDEVAREASSGERRRKPAKGSRAPVAPWSDPDEQLADESPVRGSGEPLSGESSADDSSYEGASAGGSSGRSGRSLARRRFGSGFPRRGKRGTADEPGGPADPEIDQAADPHSVARTILLDKLTGQPRTRAELADLLAEREIPNDVADEVLDRFTEVGLIDDAAFANAWVESRHRGRGLGKRALAQELRRRGVDDQLARNALDELDPDQEEETARALVRRKLPAMRSLDRQVAMRRLLGLLARKGYPSGLALRIIKEELSASHEELPLLDPSGLEPD
jgi:regulatory protein